MMELLARLERDIQGLEQQGLKRRRRVAETACAPQVMVDGKPMLAFCSNDYLGLANHPQITEALRQGASLYGTGSGASHLISGHSLAHARLEERLAEFMSPHLESAQALYFCTGYMANLAVVSALAGKDAVIFSETLNHASLIDGTRLARSQVKIFPHRDAAALSAMLDECQADTKLVVTDSVFSMDGDIAPLTEILALCEKHGAWMVVDDAHGFGVLGEHGRGALEHFSLRSPNIVYMGTLGKAAGVAGAFVAAHATVIEWLVQRARPYIYTTAGAPALAHALLTSLDIIGSDEGAQRRAHLQAMIAQLKTALDGLQQWQLMASDTAIQPLVIGENEAALHVAADLQNEGIWVPAIRPPTVPPGTARLRISLSAAHNKNEVAQLTAALMRLENLTERKTKQ
jgi:8-amino-7-oxononanoate synthase